MASARSRRRHGRLTVHVHPFDRYRAGTSLLHRLDARVKVAGTLLIVLSNALLPDGAWAAFAATWVLVIGLSMIAGFGPFFAQLRSAVALPFLAAALSALVVVPGRPLLPIDIGPLSLVVTDGGVLRFSSIVIRSLLSVQTAILLTATTPFPDVLHALRHLGVPGVIVTIVSLMYRYIFVLADEAARLMRAREARSARPDGATRAGGSLIWRASTAGHMAGQLFLRSYERSDRVYNAMLARGLAGEHRTLTPHVLRGADLRLAAALMAILAIVQLLGRAAVL